MMTRTVTMTTSEAGKCCMELEVLLFRSSWLAYKTYGT